MTDSTDDRTEMERLMAEFTVETTEDEAIQLFHRMHRVLDDLILHGRLATPGSPEAEEFDQALNDQFQDFYRSYCDASDAGYVRAKKVWWCLAEAILHSVSNDFGLVHSLWLSALRWISLDPNRWDPFDVIQLFRLFLDDDLGPLLLDFYFVESDDVQRRNLWEGAQLYFSRQNRERLNEMLPDWLDDPD
jgi:hypothetical protein